MAIDPNDMYQALINYPHGMVSDAPHRAYIPTEDIKDEEQDFKAGRRWDDAYPYQREQFQRHMQPQQEMSGLFGVPQQRLMQMAGDVVPMYPPGMEPANSGIHTDKSAGMAYGTAPAPPNVVSIGLPTLDKWRANMWDAIKRGR